MGRHAARVGEWIQVRRDELGLSIKDFAQAVGTSPRTVGNVESGATEARAGTRARWEDALGWERGSLTAAYRRGTRPGPTASVADLSGMDAAIRADPDLSDEDKAALQRIYRAMRQPPPPPRPPAPPARRKEAQ